MNCRLLACLQPYLPPLSTVDKTTSVIWTMTPVVVSCKWSVSWRAALTRVIRLCAMHCSAGVVSTQTRRMKELIQALSWKAEIAIVIWIAFGLFLYSNIVMLLTGQVGTPETTSISTEDMRFLIRYEVTVMVVLSAFL